MAQLNAYKIAYLYTRINPKTGERLPFTNANGLPVPEYDERPGAATVIAHCVESAAEKLRAYGRTKVRGDMDLKPYAERVDTITNAELVATIDVP